MLFFLKGRRELYNAGKPGIEIGSWVKQNLDPWNRRSLVGPIYFRKHGSQNGTPLEGSQNENPRVAKYLSHPRRCACSALNLLTWNQ
jgi:hypothetical protein